MRRLELVDGEKKFGGLTAVSAVSMVVDGSGITGLIGPNGAGKSTIVNMASGLMAPSKGIIRVDGQDIDLLQPHEVARLGVARTFQTVRLLEEATVLRNVFAGTYRLRRRGLLLPELLNPRGRPRGQSALLERVRELIDLFELSRFVDSPAGTLSYGNQRRVEIARALASEPAHLLLDEPAAGMNDHEAERLGSSLLRVIRPGIGVLLIEHNMRFLMSLCSDIYVVNSGVLIAHGSPAQVQRDSAVVAAYLGS